MNKQNLSDWQCPICEKMFKRVEATEHLETCLPLHPLKSTEIQQAIYKTWLKEKFDIKDIKKKYVNSPLSSEEGLYSLTDSQFLEFENLLRDKDEVYMFCTPEDAWQHHAGRLGWAIVRDGVVVGLMVTYSS